MNELNIHLMSDLDNNFLFNEKNIETISIITEGNPGTISIMLEICKTQKKDDIVAFINKIWKQNIKGARLWYIYKNECNHNIVELLSKDLSKFNDDYFYENFEKYF